jgi:sulfur carrier protein ThiS
MRVEVSLCAVLRYSSEACGPGGAETGTGEIEVADGATLGELVGALGLPEGVTAVACVNGKNARDDTRLADGDQVYVFLPVSGG